MNIKALLSSVVIGTASIFGGVQSAEAVGHECYWTVKNDHVCVYNVRGNDYYRTYDLEVNGRYAGNQSVVCHQEHRYNYVENANGIACFQFSH